MTARFALLPAAALLSFVAAACRDPAEAPDRDAGGSGVRLANAPAHGESPVDHPHVVFSRQTLVIARLGVSVVPPTTISSRPSPETLESEDPSVVQVETSGALVGLRRGRTRIRSVRGEGSVLEVEVVAPRAIKLEPARLELAPERAGAFALLDAETGERLPPEAAEWGTDSPARATIREGKVQAGGDMGPASVWVRLGDATAQAVVLVRPAAGDSLEVAPATARLRAGEVRVFQAHSPSGPVGAEWTSSNARVAEPLQAGLVQARAAGRASICATALGRRACSRVEVRP